MQGALYVALLACCIPLSRALRPPVATKPQSWRRRMAAADGVPSAVPASIPGPATVAEWHTARRRAILAAHPEVAALRGPDKRTVPYLVLCNALQLGTAVAVGRARALPWPAAAALAVGVGGTLSLHSFACLHDLLHGSAAAASSRPQREALLFWLSQPNMFGYYLYLRRGHLAHHAHTGEASNLDVFASRQTDFEDGDVLFAGHRQAVPGPAFPKALSPRAFRLWRRGRAPWNAVVYSCSMALERVLLCVNDKVVCVVGSNKGFFANKPDPFHATCRRYARWSCAVQAAVLAAGGWRALGYLLVAEVAWQLPVHPASAAFVTNHGSGATRAGTCRPTTSLYGRGRFERWFDLLTCCSNLHTEHHDFPEIALARLPALTRAAPEFYARPHSAAAGAAPPDHLVPPPQAGGVWSALHGAFAEPETYACAASGCRAA